MKQLHWKQEMKYLNKVAEYLISLGYEVDKPSTKHRNLLDVWGTDKGRKCYVEIYVIIHGLDNGIMGYWMQGDNEDEEVYYDTTHYNELDTRFFPLSILDGLKPIHKAKESA